MLSRGRKSNKPCLFSCHINEEKRNNHRFTEVGKEGGREGGREGATKCMHGVAGSHHISSMLGTAACHNTTNVARLYKTESAACLPNRRLVRRWQNRCLQREYETLISQRWSADLELNEVMARMTASESTIYSLVSHAEHVASCRVVSCRVTNLFAPNRPCLVGSYPQLPTGRKNQILEDKDRQTGNLTYR